MAMRKRYSYKSNFISKLDPIVRLWMMRILIPLGAQRAFFDSSGFNDETLAYEVGLGHWIEPAPLQFDLTAIRNRGKSLRD